MTTTADCENFFEARHILFFIPLSFSSAYQKQNKLEHFNLWN
jgi:hypothetical protein